MEACSAIMPATSSTHWRRSRGTRSMSSLPASIFEKSRMSLRMVSSADALDADRFGELALCRRSSGVSSSSSVMPSTPFIGVRIS